MEAPDPIQTGLSETPFRRAMLVVNPTSGRGQGVKVAQELAEALGQKGIASETHVTRERGDGLRAMRAKGTDYDLAIAIGGDGTIRETLEGLVDTEVPVAVVPAGTANVLAGCLGLRRDVHHTLEVILGNQPRDLNVARVNGRLSMLCVGVGFDGWAVREMERTRKGASSMRAYAKALTVSFRRFEPKSLSVTLDGVRRKETFGSVLVSNTARYAGAVKLSPEARLDDGLFEVYLFPTGTRLELARALTRGLVRHLPGGAVTMERARSVRIECDEEVPCQIDGDAAGATPVELEVQETRFRILAP